MIGSRFIMSMRQLNGKLQSKIDRFAYFNIEFKTQNEKNEELRFSIEIKFIQKA